MKRSRGAVFQAGGAKAKQGQDAVLPTSEVAQLSPRQRGVSQIVIAVDVFIPQSGVRAAQDRLQMHAGQLMHRSGQRRLWGAPESVLDSARASFAVARGRQLQKPLTMHAQHGHPAAHLLEAPVRFAPLEQSTCQSGQLGARAARIVGNQGAQLPDLLASEAAAAVALHAASRPEGRPQAALWAGSISQGRNLLNCGGARLPDSAQDCR